jgi:hypothetical protein
MIVVYASVFAICPGCYGCSVRAYAWSLCSGGLVTVARAHAR